MQHRRSPPQLSTFHFAVFWTCPTQHFCGLRSSWRSRLNPLVRRSGGVVGGDPAPPQSLAAPAPLRAGPTLMSVGRVEIEKTAPRQPCRIILKQVSPALSNLGPQAAQGNEHHPAIHNLGACPATKATLGAEFDGPPFSPAGGGTKPSNAWPSPRPIPSSPGAIERVGCWRAPLPSSGRSYGPLRCRGGP